MLLQGQCSGSRYVLLQFVCIECTILEGIVRRASIRSNIVSSLWVLSLVMVQHTPNSETASQVSLFI